MLLNDGHMQRAVFYVGTRLQSDEDHMYRRETTLKHWVGEQLPVLSGWVMAVKPTWHSPNLEHNLAAMDDAVMLVHSGFFLSTDAWKADPVLKEPYLSSLRKWKLPL